MKRIKKEPPKPFWNDECFGISADIPDASDDVSEEQKRMFKLVEEAILEDVEKKEKEKEDKEKKRQEKRERARKKKSLSSPPLKLTVEQEKQKSIAIKRAQTKQKNLEGKVIRTRRIIVQQIGRAHV